MNSAAHGLEAAGLMHIAIDALGAKFGGAETELTKFLEANLADPRVSQMTVFCSPRTKRFFEFPPSDKIREIQKPWIDSSYALRILWYEFFLGWACRRIGADVLLASANFGRGRFKVPHIVYVQQSLPFCKEAIHAYASPRARMQISLYGWQMKRSCSTAKRVICQSSEMQRSVAQIAGVSPHKVLALFPAPKRLEISERYSPQLVAMRSEYVTHRLLYVGTDAPYKKLDTLIQAMRIIRGQLPNSSLFLTLPPSHPYGDEPGVVCVGYLKGPALTEAYQRADVLVLPSLVESGPQPPLEAMSVGTPVLAADRPYAHDAFGTAAEFFDPLVPEELAKKALNLLRNHIRRKQFIEQGARLVQKRSASQPYKRMLEICIEEFKTPKQSISVGDLSLPNGGMHLAIDSVGAKYGGSVTGLLGFLEAAIADSRVKKITVFSSPNSERFFDFPVSEKIHLIEKRFINKNYLGRLLWYEFLLASSCRSAGADVLFISANFGRARSIIPQITYVRQSLPFSQEAIDTSTSVMGRLQIYSYRWQMRRSCLSANRVICQSSLMQRSVRALVASSPEKVVTIYSEPRSLDVPATPTPQLAAMRSEFLTHRLLYVGADAPYKKLDSLIKAMGIIRSKLRQCNLFLTLPSSHPYATEPGVECLGYLGAPSLAEAYALADMLVLPSLVESGPQPPLEAMSLGTPVLIADRPYAREICEDAAIFFDPFDANDLAKKALFLLENETLRNQVIEKGFRLVQKRTAARPYERMVDICFQEFVRANGNSRGRNATSGAIFS